MLEVNIPDEIFQALSESAKAMQETTDALNSSNENKEKDAVKETNLVKKPEVPTSLTSAERKRYQEIGKELFKPFFSSLEKLLAKERRNAEMTASHPEKTINDNLKVQYSEKKEPKKKDDGIDIVTVILQIVALAGVAIMLFKDKIANFFSNLWDNVTSAFSKVWDFFNPFKEDSPIYKIITTYIDFWKTAWSNIWDFIKPLFSKLGEWGTTIWNWIKGAWDRFITGPNGILSFGTKIWSGLKNFVSNGFGAISSFIVDSIVDPLKSIFSDSKEDAEEAANREKEGIQNKVNEATDNGAEKLEKSAESLENASKSESDFSTQTASAADQTKSLKFIANKNFSGEKLKQSAATNAMNSFLNRYNIDADEKERARYQQIFEKHISLQGNEAKFNMKEITAELKKQAEIDSDDQWYDTKLVDTLQDIKDGELDYLSKDIENGMRSYMENANAGTIAQNTSAPGMDANALAANVPPEQTEFAATQELIIQSVGSLQASLESFDGNIIQTFTNIFEGFVDKFIKALKIDIKITTPKHVDTKNYKYEDIDNATINNSQTINDYSPTMVNVIPISKKSFEIMNDKIYALVEESVNIITAQNKLLSDIRDVIGVNGNNSNVKAAPIIIPAAPSRSSSNSSPRGNSRISTALTSELWQASRPISSSVK